MGSTQNFEQSGSAYGKQEGTEEKEVRLSMNYIQVLKMAKSGAKLAVDVSEANKDLLDALTDITKTMIFFIDDVDKHGLVTEESCRKLIRSLDGSVNDILGCSDKLTDALRDYDKSAT